MAVQVRRVVTGHDSKGRAVVKIDEVSKNITSNRPGASACVVWTTESFPVNNTGDADEGLRKVGTTLKNGTVFRVIEFAPGVRRCGGPSKSGRRARAARNNPQLGQPRHPALCDGFHPYRRQARGRRWESLERRGVVKQKLLGIGGSSSSLRKAYDTGRRSTE